MQYTHNKPLEFILCHDGKSWIASREGVEFSGLSLEEIDRRILHYLTTIGMIQDATSVCMRFDLSTLPRWLHQYSGHYFNRTVTYTTQTGAVENHE